MRKIFKFYKKENKWLLKENIRLKNSLRDIHNKPEIESEKEIEKSIHLTSNSECKLESTWDISIYKDKISLLEAVNTNLASKINQNIQNNSQILCSLQSYDRKTKEILNTIIRKSEEKLQIFNDKLLKMEKQLHYFKENSTKVNYFYNNLVVK